MSAVGTVETKDINLLCQVDVCPVGKTTGCKKIGITVPTPPVVEVEIPHQYTAGIDYTASEIAPPITAPPPLAQPTGSVTALTHYTSYSQITASGNLVVIPVIVPIPIGEPIPPIDRRRWWYGAEAD